MSQQVMVDAINQNFRQIEAESRRKVVTDEDGFDRILIGKKEDGKYAIKVSAPGYDVDDATDDQLVMSSDWNMWKIIRSGEITAPGATTRRAGTITLNSTYIGYTFNLYIDMANFNNSVAYAETWAGKVLLKMSEYYSKGDMKSSGLFYNDGTNNLVYNMHYGFVFNTSYLLLQFNVRCTAGSYNFTPQTEVPIYRFYYQIANPTRNVPYGAGGMSSGIGKYLYIDSVVFNEAGTITGALESITREFLIGEPWQKYPDSAPLTYHTSM